MVNWDVWLDRSEKVVTIAVSIATYIQLVKAKKKKKRSNPGRKKR